MNPLGRRGTVVPTLPQGEVLGTYASYPEAQDVVDRLGRLEFPVARLAIVGNDLKTVERVTGKLSYGRAALAGALSGFWLGVFLAIVVTLFSNESTSVAGGTFGVIGAAALMGAGFGMLYGVASYGASKKRRDFTSTHQVVATNYQIVVDSELLIRAQELLARR